MASRYQRFLNFGINNYPGYMRNSRIIGGVAGFCSGCSIEVKKGEEMSMFDRVFIASTIGLTIGVLLGPFIPINLIAMSYKKLNKLLKHE